MVIVQASKKRFDQMIEFMTKDLKFLKISLGFFTFLLLCTDEHHSAVVTLDIRFKNKLLQLDS